MRIIDLWRMSLGNLWRRKLRTFLTVLGVIIGTASIVVMISLGIGINATNRKQVESYASLTRLEVMNYGGVTAMREKEGLGGVEDGEKLVLDDKAMETIAALPHVSIATPVLEISVLARIGKYESYLSIQGITLDALEKMDLPIQSGALPHSGGALSLVLGSDVAASFYNPKEEPKFDPETGMPLPPDIDFLRSPLLVVFDMDAYYQAQSGMAIGGVPVTGTDDGGENDDGGTVAAPPKKYAVPVTAMLERTQKESDYSCYADKDALELQLRRIFKNKPIPGQPTTESGKPLKELQYTRAIVYADDMNNVLELQEQIKAMGYECYSNMDWIKQLEEQSRTLQTVLGAIGAVSLLVAAIGIANTMMMSVYERTREIGIIKVLGCSLPNIRSVFLAEAAMIGLFGGLLGIGFSELISYLLNRFLAQNMMGQPDAVISLIPLWLALAALAFSTLVGILAGLAPALRATRLSPLAAIRSE
jgi:ABC-type lipoprotein release transport system permease subunit